MNKTIRIPIAKLANTVLLACTSYVIAFLIIVAIIAFLNADWNVYRVWSTCDLVGRWFMLLGYVVAVAFVKGCRDEL